MTLNKIAYLSLGLGSTSPLLAIVVGKHIVSLMTISLIVVFIDLLFSNKNHNTIYKSSTLFVLFCKWMVISVLASVFGFLYFFPLRTDYSYATISYIPKILLYLILLILLGKSCKHSEKCFLIIHGIKIGIALNLIWSIADASMYYSIRESLTNLVFHSYISAADMHFGVASIIDGVTIRSVGLNNDPATIGFFSTVASAYAFVSKKKWVIVIALLASLASVSFVGLVGIILVAFFNLIYLNQAISFRSIVVTILFITTSALVFNLSGNSILDSFRSAIEIRAESKTEDDHSTSVRRLFLEKFPGALSNMPTALIIGTGYSTAVYPYLSEGLDYGVSPTTMENTYVDNFFSFGLIGFVYFILFHYCMYRNARAKMRVDSSEVTIILYSFSLGIPISYLFYHYTLYSVIMLISLCSILCLSRPYRSQVKRVI